MTSLQKIGGRVVRAPLVHFLALGGLLFVLRPEPGGGLGERPTVVVSAELSASDLDQELLLREARRLDLGLGDQAIRQRLVSKMRAVTADLSLDDEALYRQARDLGLDDDVVVRRQLREKMRLLLRRGLYASATDGEPSDEELQACLERHRERFARPASVSFTQVFISSAVHGAAAGERAAEVAAAVRTLTPEEAVEWSDPFPLAARSNARSRAETARRFGDGFAQAVWDLEPGRWSAPIASLFGLHLVWVHESRPGALPPLDEVRPQVVRLWREERSEVRLAEGLEKLRQLYQVRVEWPETRLAETEVGR